MVSSVLKSKRAITVNIRIMRTFRKIREMLITHKDLTWRLDELEKKYDTQFRVVFDACSPHVRGRTEALGKARSVSNYLLKECNE
jgi:hypothetical protein